MRPSSTTASRAGTGWRVLAGVGSALAGVLFVLGVAGMVRDGLADLWTVGLVLPFGVWALLLGAYARTGARPGASERMRRALTASAIGGALGIPVTAWIAHVVAPGSETAPVLVAMTVMPVAATLGLVVGWLLPLRTRAERAEGP
jgi:hypothetical protein